MAGRRGREDAAAKKETAPREDPRSRFLCKVDRVASATRYLVAAARGAATAGFAAARGAATARLAAARGAATARFAAARAAALLLAGKHALQLGEQTALFLAAAGGGLAAARSASAAGLAARGAATAGFAAARGAATARLAAARGTAAAGLTRRTTFLLAEQTGFRSAGGEGNESEGQQSGQTNTFGHEEDS